MELPAAICLAISLLELILNFLVLPLSVLNFCVLLKTAIINVNLRWLLLYQCLAIVVYAMGTIVDIGTKLAHGGDLWVVFNDGVIMFRTFGLLLTSLAGIILTAERVIATLFFRRYENCKRPHVAVISILIIVWNLKII